VWLRGLKHEISLSRSKVNVSMAAEWQMNKTVDELNQLLRQYPEVQLATLADEAPEGDQWLHEIKFDGYRLLGFVSGGASRLRTRNGKDWTDSFPSLAAALES